MVDMNMLPCICMSQPLQVNDMHVDAWAIQAATNSTNLTNKQKQITNVDAPIAAGQVGSRCLHHPDHILCPDMLSGDGREEWHPGPLQHVTA